MPATATATTATATKGVIVKYKGELYDVTDFVDSHPGGKDRILDFQGKDMTEAMMR